MREVYGFSELCDVLGKPAVYVRKLQQSMKLPIPSAQEGYSEAYLEFMHKVVALRTLNVPTGDIVDLLEREKRILELLHCDSISDSPTWYLDACATDADPRHRLMLTGYDLGFPVDSDAVQSNLDFTERNPELFAGVEMGEDVKRVMAAYLELTGTLKQRIEREIPVLENALEWTDEILWDRSRNLTR
jgi:hypothetical protein